MPSYIARTFGGSSPALPAASNPSAFLDSIIPGLGSQQNQVSGIISNLLNGTPSPSTTRNAAAEFGAANGLGDNSGFQNRLGYDLYNQEGQKNQQTGLQDLLSSIQGYSSPLLTNKGQNNENMRYFAGQNQNQNQFNSDLNYKTNQDMLDLLAKINPAAAGAKLTGNKSPVAGFIPAAATWNKPF